MNKIFENLQHIFQTPFQGSVLVFVVILFIILLAPLIFRSIKIPGIIGLIISGLIVGPHGLNLIEKNSAVDLFSTIGLLYIMFLAGLELDLKEFDRNKHKSIVFGLFTFILPFSIGFPVCHHLLGFSFETSLLVSSMFSTHTLVTYPVVSRIGIARNKAVAITVGGTILTDTAVLIILALIGGSAGGEIDIHFWIRFGISVLLFLFIVFMVIPRMTYWFFRHLENEKNSHFIFVLSMVFLSALFSEIAGLEPIIGAFAAGIALNKLIPRTSSLMNRVEFVGNSLFIPFFLISVGMLINPRVIFQGTPAMIIAVTLTVTAIAGKYIAALFTSLIYKFSVAQRNLIFGLSSSHAAATIAVIMVGYRIGLVDDNILNGTIVLILVTCLVASFVTEYSAKKIMLTGEVEKPSISTFGDQKILVPIYNPNNMERLLDLAMAIKIPRNPFPIVSLSVVEDDQKAIGKLIEAKKMLEKAMMHASASDQKVEIMTAISQNVPSGIKRVAKEIFASEIIIGFALKRQFTDLLFGNTVKYIVENTWQSVWVCSISPNLFKYNRISVICPKHAEHEYGFNHWADRIFRLSDTLKIPTEFLSTANTYNSISEHLKRNGTSLTSRHIEFNHWDDFTSISSFVLPTDLVMIILPRKGGVSYESSQENIPRLMSKQFENYNFILVYPSVAVTNTDMMFSNDFDPGLIEKGIKSISEIFQKKNS